ncbi:uncharacterized protein LOC110008818 isoform X1 [Jatropha curcas]|uniref:uncharacterized protein LOC110008818 isoform X1 n=1 Tax=Jatropha curcas TaxID=180498 RepID=UPI0009D78E3D|nr:uncharacterized protein LOC110008818 isoform X1 [Jatropha curcas]
MFLYDPLVLLNRKWKGQKLEKRLLVESQALTSAAFTEEHIQSLRNYVVRLICDDKEQLTTSINEMRVVSKEAKGVNDVARKVKKQKKKMASSASSDTELLGFQVNWKVSGNAAEELNKFDLSLFMEPAEPEVKILGCIPLKWLPCWGY